MALASLSARNGFADKVHEILVANCKTSVAKKHMHEELKKLRQASELSNALVFNMLLACVIVLNTCHWFRTFRTLCTQVLINLV